MYCTVHTYGTCAFEVLTPSFPGQYVLHLPYTRAMRVIPITWSRPDAMWFSTGDFCWRRQDDASFLALPASDALQGPTAPLLVLGTARVTEI